MMYNCILRMLAENWRFHHNEPRTNIQYSKYFCKDSNHSLKTSANGDKITVDIILVDISIPKVSVV